jgi:HEAT repeat protein
VRRSGRPGAGNEAQAVVAQLIPLLARSATPVRREVLWMLSEIGGAEAVGPMAALLADRELKEDARQALLRLPGPAVTAALRSAMASAPEEFKYHLAEALRIRGETVAGYPSQKLKPTKQTTVQAAPAGG